MNGGVGGGCVMQVGVTYFMYLNIIKHFVCGVIKFRLFNPSISCMVIGIWI